MARDPVCGMEAKEHPEADTSKYEGRTFYFCSDECKREFDNNPDRYSKEPEITDQLAKGRIDDN